MKNDDVIEIEKNGEPIVANLALAKEILGEGSRSFQLILRSPELFEIMFPGVYEYISNEKPQEKRDFIEALSLITEIEEESLNRTFSSFILPVRIMKEKLQL